MENKYRIQESVRGRFKAQKLTTTIKTLFGHAFGRPRRKWEVIRGKIEGTWPSMYANTWNSYAKAEKCMLEEMRQDLKRAENNGKEWGPVTNKTKEGGVNTNYEKATSLKKEYEDLKKQLESIKNKMVDVKQKAKDELNWIMSDEVEKQGAKPCNKKTAVE